MKIALILITLLIIVLIISALPNCQRTPQKVIQVMYGSTRNGDILSTYILENGRQESEYKIVNVGDIKHVCN